MKHKIAGTIILFVFAAGISLLFTGCNKEKGEDEHEHDEAQSIAVTLWTPNMEMFTEYEIPVKGEKIKFIIHLTKLADFSPVRSGKVILKFKNNTGSIIADKEQTELLREGIFTPVITFKDKGKVTGSITYIGEGINETFDLGMIVVYGDHQNIPEDKNGDSDKISFLKEQQWKTEFETEEVRKMNIRPSIKAIGEVIPRQQDHVAVTAPLAGVLDPAVNRYMAAPGSYVKKGDVIALLAPQAGAGESWQQVKLALSQAKDRYQRAEKLIKNGAVSKREYEDLRREYLLLKAGFPENSREKNNYFSVNAPISGIIEKLYALPGRYLEKGDTILHITNRSKVWLQLNIYEIDLDKINNPSGADIRTTGTEGVIPVSSENLRLLSKRGTFDKQTGSVPFIFEVTNPEMKLKIGQMVEARLYTDIEKEALCVPLSAVYNDEARKVIFIQSGGESFEKRTVRTGSVFRGYIEILSGAATGEHVVSKGAYFVKLAGTSTPIGHGHTH